MASFLSRYRNGAISKDREGAELRALVTKLAALTGKSRRASRRFAKRLGVTVKQQYRNWTKSDQQRLLDLIAIHPPHDVAKIMHRTLASVRAMLWVLGASAQMGRDWFTKYTLSQALHIRATEVQKWIDHGWLKVRKIETGRLTKEIIDSDDFVTFCKEYRSVIVGRRLTTERLDFVQNFVFPASHTELLPVREAKKERAAFQAQQEPKPPESEDEGMSHDYDGWRAENPAS